MGGPKKQPDAAASTAPAVISKDAIAELLLSASADVKKKLASIEEATNAPLKTNGKFRYTPSSNAHELDLTTCQDLNALVAAAGFVVSKEAEYQSGVDALGLQTAPLFKWIGYDKDSWITDIKNRARVITSEAKKKELVEINKELETHFTQEMRVSTLLEKLQNI